MITCLYSHSQMSNEIPYHIGPENRYSLEFANPDREIYKEHLSRRATERGVSIKAREFTIETDDRTQTLYTVYRNKSSRNSLEQRSRENIEEALDEYTDSELLVMVVIINVFVGIEKKIEEESGRFTIYKEMDIESIPDILTHPNGETRLFQFWPDNFSRGLSSPIRCQTPITEQLSDSLSGIFAPMMNCSVSQIPVSMVCGTSGLARIFMTQSGCSLSAETVIRLNIAVNSVSM